MGGITRAEYMPTTESIRAVLTDERDWAATESVPSGRHLLPEDFDRWLGAHDVEVAANALREAVEEFESAVGLSELSEQSERDGLTWVDEVVGAAWNAQGPFLDWLRNRADRIEHAASTARAEGSTPIVQHGDPQPNPESGNSETERGNR